jgi:hypothetical protein
MEERQAASHSAARLSEWEAHREAMSVPPQEAVRRLVSLLGAPTVAAIGGVKETRAVQQWTEDRLPQRIHALRCALQVASMICSASDLHVARAWFHGANPDLDDRVPVMLLRDEPLEAVQSQLLAAARAFVAPTPDARQNGITRISAV